MDPSAVGRWPLVVLSYQRGIHKGLYLLQSIYSILQQLAEKRHKASKEKLQLFLDVT